MCLIHSPSKLFLLGHRFIPEIGRKNLKVKPQEAEEQADREPRYINPD